MSNENNGSLVSVGTLIGNIATAIGRDGEDGKSAYQLAVENGFAGTEAEWLESLKAVVENESVNPDMLDRAYWQILVRNPVVGYGYLDSIIDESDSSNTIYRVELSGLSPIRNVVGEGSFAAIVRGDKSGLYLFNITNGEGWIYRKGVYELVPAEGDLKEIPTKGAEITLTLEQIDALDKLFELAAYTDESISTEYNNFITAFGLDRYRVMKVIDSNGIVPCGISNYYDVSLVNTQWLQYNGIPYTRTVNEAVENASEIDRSCYPYFDIPAEGGYSYQIYFEATNADVQISLEFYNETALAAIAAGEDYSQSDRKDGYGWQSSMGYEWTPPTEHNGSLIKAMRLNFSSKDAGIQKVIIYRKKVV